MRSALRLPKPTDPAPALPVGITPDVAGIAPAITPNADFYQIDVALSAPVIDAAGWSLAVTGQVDSPLTLTLDQLLAMPSIERHIALTCVSNEVGGDLVGTARWQGVRLTDVLAKVGVQDGADLVMGVSVDGFTTGFPRVGARRRARRDDRLRHERRAAAGAPRLPRTARRARSLRLRLRDEVAARDPAHHARGRHPLLAAARLGAGRQHRGRLAHRRPTSGRPGRAPGRSPSAVAPGTSTPASGSVEVSVDDGPWQAATLAAPIGTDAWRLWSWQWQATSGTHRLRVRMHDLDGTPQDGDERPVFPGASSGLHTITVEVA